MVFSANVIQEHGMENSHQPVRAPKQRQEMISMRKMAVGKWRRLLIGLTDAFIAAFAIFPK